MELVEPNERERSFAKPSFPHWISNNALPLSYEDQTLVFNLATRFENFDSTPQLKNLYSTGSFFSFELFEKYLEIV